MGHLHRVMPVVSVGLGLLLSTANTASSAPFVQTDLVSDIPGLATITDSSLVNPWGVSRTTTSPFWISDQGTNLTNLWSVTGPTTVAKVTAVNPPTGGNIAIPTTASGPQGPTGQVSNQNPSPSSFPVGGGGNGGSAHFIFANLNGTISAWDTGGTAFIQVTTPGANYSGLAINQAQTQLYAANQAGTGSINVFNSSFAPVSLGAGAFATPAAIGALGLVPFNVQDINGNIYVTYAPMGLAAQRAATAGMGAVAVFTEGGVLLQTIVGGQLASPWGVTLAPASFGQFGGDLLVGNFSFVDSEINAFNASGMFAGTIPVDPGSGNTPGGLWSLEFGIGGMNGDPNTLYFTDGINGEAHGLFAALSVAAVPEPSTLALLGAGLLSLCALRRRRSARPRGGLLKG
jgi:uncharacterized protein (TIGR03118 family)